LLCDEGPLCKSPCSVKPVGRPAVCLAELVLSKDAAHVAVDGSRVPRVDYLAVGGLTPVSFGVSRHECRAVVGPPGAGKTRLLRAIADLDAADGFVHLEGAERREVPALNGAGACYASAEPAW